MSLTRAWQNKKIQQRNRAVKHGKICIEILLAVEKKAAELRIAV